MSQAPLTLTTLKNRREFLAVAATEVKYVAPAFVLQCGQPRDNHENKVAVRLGYTASKKVGGAVQRSLAKRRLRAMALEVVRESLDENQQRFLLSRDFVLIARRTILTKPFAESKADLEKAIQVMVRKQGQNR